MSVSGLASLLKDMGLRCLFQTWLLFLKISTWVCDVCFRAGLSSERSQHGSAMSVSGLASRLGNINAGLPTENDYQGSLSSLIRLQRVYTLSVQHMYAGNYSGYEGPALQPEDAFLLGRQAFMDGYLQEAIQWLKLAVDVMRSPETASSAPGVTPFSLAQTASLLGRAFFFVSSAWPLSL